MQLRSKLAICVAAGTLLACSDPSRPALPPDASSVSGSEVAPSTVASPSGPLDLHVTIQAAGWTVVAQGRPAGGPCAAISTTSALTGCARFVKAGFLDDASVQLTADPAVPYGRLIATLDALRADEQGDLFPEFNLALPTGAPASPAPKQSATPEPPNSGIAPTGTQPIREPSDDAVVIRISKTQVTVGDESEPIVSYGGSPLDGGGFPATSKANGPNDIYIVPLARVLARYRARDVKVRAAKGADTSTSEVMIVADESTPYRALYEVIYTAGQSNFGRYHLLVRSR